MAAQKKTFERERVAMKGDLGLLNVNVLDLGMSCNILRQSIEAT